jgi:hypothetical protein
MGNYYIQSVFHSREFYLDSLCFKQRSILTKFRLSAHSLRIETGRYEKCRDEGGNVKKKNWIIYILGSSFLNNQYSLSELFKYGKLLHKICISFTKRHLSLIFLLNLDLVLIPYE